MMVNTNVLLIHFFLIEVLISTLTTIDTVIPHRPATTIPNRQTLALPCPALVVGAQISP
jgi:hypothetical protein